MNVNALELSDFLAFCAEKELKRDFFNSIFMKNGFAFGLDSAACAVRDIAANRATVVDFCVVSQVISSKSYEATRELLDVHRMGRIRFLQSYIEGLEKAMRLARTFAASYREV